MKERDIWPVVEIVFKIKQEKDSALYIGPIEDVFDENYHLYCYDAEGKWEKVYDLDLDEIFKIEFEDKYSRHFNAYMRQHRMPAP